MENLTKVKEQDTFEREVVFKPQAIIVRVEKKTLGLRFSSLGQISLNFLSGRVKFDVESTFCH